jgi:hypothetical protein
MANLSGDIMNDLREFDCRNNRLAQMGLAQDGFAAAVEDTAECFGRGRVGVFLGTSTAGILQTELAYRRRDPVTGALPAGFIYEDLESLRQAIPAARSLPFLQAIAQGKAARVVIDYLDPLSLAVEFVP